MSFLDELWVLGPEESILARVGEAVEFPCRLSSYQDAEHMEIRWFRTQVSNVVYLYQEPQGRSSPQMAQFRNRTLFEAYDIAEGSVNLHLLSVVPSDEGRYGCRFLSHNFSGEAMWELEVAGMLSQASQGQETEKRMGLELQRQSRIENKQQKQRDKTLSVAWRDNFRGLVPV